MPQRMTVMSTAATPETLFIEILPWTLVGLVLIIIGVFAVMMLRRMLRDGNVQSDSDSFTLQTLRDLHAKGTLSDEEFEKAKRAMISRIAGPSQQGHDGRRSGRDNASSNNDSDAANESDPPSHQADNASPNNKRRPND